MDDKTIRMLEKALAANPGDWEVRLHIAEAHLVRNDHARALAILQSAPAPAAGEAALLLLAKVQAHADPSAALQTITQVLAANKGCAEAYLLRARLLLNRGMLADARKDYGIATVIDEKLEDLQLRRELGKPLAGDESADAPDEDEGNEDADGEGDGAESAQAVSRPSKNDDPPPMSIEELTAAALGGSLPRITFSDVGGMEDVKERIRMNIIYPFNNPQIFAKFKKRAGGGILMYGPPGCGKTYIARATAGECKAAFMSIAITDVLSKWHGESERRMHELFELGRRRAPAIVFIDEVDALGMSRNDARGSLMATLVNVFLTELDGSSARNENVLVLAATNAPWHVDNALRRPGRFDRVMFIPPPDTVARQEILRLCLKDIPTEKISYEKTAKLLDGFSGADIAGLVSTASEEAIYAEMKSGRALKITDAMLLKALKAAAPSTGEWLATAKNYASYANRGGLYDDLVKYFEQRR